MKITISLALLLIGLVFRAQAQTSFQSDYGFIKHLESISSYDEASFFLRSIKDNHASEGQQDTISFYQGKFNYLKKNRFESISFFKNVGKSNLSYWNAAKFYSALQFAYLDNYEAGLSELSMVENLSSEERELLKLEQAGFSLLTRNYAHFDQISTSFDSEFFQFTEHQDELVRISSVLSGHKSKSPFLAGLFSAIVPGAGKYYIGQFGRGTMALMSNAVFALQAYEGYRKDGPKSPAFIVFGSIFSVFYVANIWGSVVAVRVQEKSFYDTQDEMVVLHMHIPLRLLYK
ncbi:MAG: hypothetical protein ABJ004_17565 [Cyclobacteriaceae bacterium]